jgi:hypothetical protein
MATRVTRLARAAIPISLIRRCPVSEFSATAPWCISQVIDTLIIRVCLFRPYDSRLRPFLFYLYHLMRARSPLYSILARLHLPLTRMH